jgi:hypothetical protein
VVELESESGGNPNTD